MINAVHMERAIASVERGTLWPAGRRAGQNSAAPVNSVPAMDAGRHVDRRRHLCRIVAALAAGAGEAAQRAVSAHHGFCRQRRIAGDFPRRQDCGVRGILWGAAVDLAAATGRRNSAPDYARRWRPPAAALGARFQFADLLLALQRTRRVGHTVPRRLHLSKRNKDLRGSGRYKMCSTHHDGAVCTRPTSRYCQYNLPM